MDATKNKLGISIITCLMFVISSGCKLSSGDTSEQEINGSFNVDNSIDNFGINGNEGDAVKCVGIGGVDGSGGFLWKPMSESDGNLVILFPSKFDKKFLDVLVEDLDGNVESGAFAGFTNPDRQTWRFSKNGAEYTGVVRADLITQECAWRVSSPEEVQD
jgi:hypothetical protein